MKSHVSRSASKQQKSGWDGVVARRRVGSSGEAGESVVSRGMLGRQGFVNGLAVQRKALTIGEPNDPYEREADRVAAEVVQRLHRPAPVVTSEAGEEQVQRQVVPSLQGREIFRKVWGPVRRSDGIVSGAASPEFESGLRAARSGGRPLDGGFREKVEPLMGQDFSGVRVHTDGRADALSRSIQAKAFTTGSDVFFRKGEYAPGSRGGQELLAHELTHVGQQPKRPRIRRKLMLLEVPMYRDLYERTPLSSLSELKDEDGNDNIPKKETMAIGKIKSLEAYKSQVENVRSDLEDLDTAWMAGVVTFNGGSSNPATAKEKEENMEGVDDKEYNSESVKEGRRKRVIDEMFYERRAGDGMKTHDGRTMYDAVEMFGNRTITTEAQQVQIEKDRVSLSAAIRKMKECEVYKSLLTAEMKKTVVSYLEDPAQADTTAVKEFVAEVEALQSEGEERGIERSTVTTFTNAWQRLIRTGKGMEERKARAVESLAVGKFVGESEASDFDVRKSKLHRAHIVPAATLRRMLARAAAGRSIEEFVGILSEIIRRSTGVDRTLWRYKSDLRGEPTQTRSGFNKEDGEDKRRAGRYSERYTSKKSVADYIERLMDGVTNHPMNIVLRAVAKVGASYQRGEEKEATGAQSPAGVGSMSHILMDVPTAALVGKGSASQAFRNQVRAQGIIFSNTVMEVLDEAVSRKERFPSLSPRQKGTRSKIPNFVAGNTPYTAPPSPTAKTVVSVDLPHGGKGAKDEKYDHENDSSLRGSWFIKMRDVGAQLSEAGMTESKWRATVEEVKRLKREIDEAKERWSRITLEREELEMQQRNRDEVQQFDLYEDVGANEDSGSHKRVKNSVVREYRKEGLKKKFMGKRTPEPQDLEPTDDSDEHETDSPTPEEMRRLASKWEEAIVNGFESPSGIMKLAEVREIGSEYLRGLKALLP